MEYVEAGKGIGIRDPMVWKKMNRIVKRGEEGMFRNMEMEKRGVRVVNLVTFSELWEPCLALAI